MIERQPQASCNSTILFYVLHALMCPAITRIAKKLL